MKEKKVKMSLSTSLALYSIIDTMINEQSIDEKGDTISTTRDLPASFLYRLIRNKFLLEKDLKAFEDARLLLISKYGKIDENNIFSIEKDKEDLFQNRLESLLDSEVEHSVFLFTPEDFEECNKEVKLSIPESAMKLLISYLVLDEAFLEDFNRKISYRKYEAKAKATKTLKKEKNAKRSKSKDISLSKEEANNLSAQGSTASILKKPSKKAKKV